MITKLKIIPLGGLGEIGKNMTAIECGSDIIDDRLQAWAFLMTICTVLTLSCRT